MISKALLSPKAPAPGADVPSLAEEDPIRLDRLTGDGGLIQELNVRAASSPDGLILRETVRLPEFRKACYYAPFQKHAIDPSLDLWPEGYNQCHPLCVTDLRQAKRGGFFVIFQLTTGEYLALLPLVTPETMAWFRGTGEDLVLEAGHWGLGPWSGNLPLLAWAKNRSLYRACEAVWRTALSSGGARLRSEKSYPAMFRYLGWCSWEEFKWAIRDDLLQDVVAEIDRSPVPIRWVLIDDGHIDEGQAVSGSVTDEQNGEVPVHEGGRQLHSLGVNRERFPEGWSPLVAAARRSGKIQWLGVWLNFNGYWGGIRPDHDLGEIGGALMEVAPGVLQPKPSAEAARAFYSALIARQRESGFDFVKVDNQAKNITFYRGRVPNAVAAVMHNHRALEAAVRSDLDAMINCMAHNNLCAFSTCHSQITRCSEDYKKGDLWRAKHHLSNSFANMLWMGQTVWGDHDMFHSSDEVAGAVMARSKAISGGPIYLSDHPANLNEAAIGPLCFADGLLLQPLAPAVPLPESAFIDTYEDSEAFRVIAPLPHRCAAVAAYNLTHPEKPVTGSLKEGDYRWAGAMLQDGEPEWNIPAGGLVAYDVKRRRIHPLSHGPMEFTIPKFDDEFFILCPVTSGWAVIGRADKHLCPAGISSIEASSEKLRVTLPESGPILFWMPSGRPALSDGLVAEDLGGGLWRIPLAIAPGERVVRITRTE